jgi:hypothetical protein
VSCMSYTNSKLSESIACTHSFIFDDSKERHGQCRREHVKRRQVRLPSVALRVVLGYREMEGVAMRYCMWLERVCRQLRFVGCMCEHVTLSHCTCKQPSNPPEAAREGCADHQLDALPSKPTCWPGPVGLLSKPRGVCVVARGFAGRGYELDRNCEFKRTVTQMRRAQRRSVFVWLKPACLRPID